jgi:hypothetical protein
MGTDVTVPKYDNIAAQAPHEVHTARAMFVSSLHMYDMRNGGDAMQRLVAPATYALVAREFFTLHLLPQCGARTCVNFFTIFYLVYCMQ